MKSGAIARTRAAPFANEHTEAPPRAPTGPEVQRLRRQTDRMTIFYQVGEGERAAVGAPGAVSTTKLWRAGPRPSWLGEISDVVGRHRALVTNRNPLEPQYHLPRSQPAPPPPLKVRAHLNVVSVPLPPLPSPRLTPPLPLTHLPPCSFCATRST